MINTKIDKDKIKVDALVAVALAPKPTIKQRGPKRIGGQQNLFKAKKKIHICTEVIGIDPNSGEHILCNKVFNAISNKNVHMRTHTNLRPY